jgi:hypothetical protein
LACWTTNRPRGGGPVVRFASPDARVRADRRRESRTCVRCRVRSVVARRLVRLGTWSGRCGWTLGACIGVPQQTPRPSYFRPCPLILSWMVRCSGRCTSGYGLGAGCGWEWCRSRSPTVMAVTVTALIGSSCPSTHCDPRAIGHRVRRRDQLLSDVLVRAGLRWITSSRVEVGGETGWPHDECPCRSSMESLEGPQVTQQLEAAEARLVEHYRDQDLGPPRPELRRVSSSSGTC